MDALNGTIMLSATQRRKPDATHFMQPLDSSKQASCTLRLSKQVGQFRQPCQAQGDALTVALSPDKREALPVERCGLLIVAHAQGDGSQASQRGGDVKLVTCLPCDCQGFLEVGASTSVVTQPKSHQPQGNE